MTDNPYDPNSAGAGRELLDFIAAEQRRLEAVCTEKKADLDVLREVLTTHRSLAKKVAADLEKARYQLMAASQARAAAAASAALIDLGELAAAEGRVRSLEAHFSSVLESCQSEAALVESDIERCQKALDIALRGVGLLVEKRRRAEVAVREATTRASTAMRR